MSVTTLFIIALALLITEVFVVSMGILGFLAFCAFAYGLIIMHQTGMADFYGVGFEFVIVIGLSIFALFAIGAYFAYKSFGKKVSVGVESMVGAKAVVVQWNDNHGKILFEGENWRAASTDTFNDGDICRITGYNNMTLTIEKDD